MSLELYLHPLASYCWKVLIALYENATPVEPRIVDLGNAESRAAFLKVWPVGKFPVLRDNARGRTLPESSIIIEYVSQHYPGGTPLLPADAGAALDVRLQDRFYDQYVHEPMQKIVGNKLRPAGQADAFGVEQARAQLDGSYALIEQRMASQHWASGDGFTLADCAASPALFYAHLVHPLSEQHPHTTAYLNRLKQRPAFARVIAEAQPYFHLFPG
jgi:glutathione S-transferase